MTELDGKPDSMKCAASDEIMRSACAKVSRFGGCPVMRCLLGGSTSASASGCRARFRLNNVSSVGEAVGWVTALLWLCYEGCTTWRVYLANSFGEFTSLTAFATRFPADSPSTRSPQAFLPDSIALSIAPAR